MDAVQASHLRTFANAIAWAMQVQKDPPTTQAEHLKSMFDTLDKSVQASTFLATPTPAAVAIKPLITPAKPTQAAAKLPAQAANIGQLAGRFFNQIPWGGQVSHVHDVQKTSMVNSDHAGLAQAKAVDFFASLSWGKAGTGSRSQLSIGTASDDPGRAQALVERLGQSVRPGLLESTLPAMTGNAAGFFTKIPWRGQASAT
jgi:hypothetical protein